MTQSSEAPSEGAFVRVVFGERDEQYVSHDALNVFPQEALKEMSREIRLSLNQSTGTTECEELALSFVRALQRAGWKFFRPGNAPHN